MIFKKTHIVIISFLMIGTLSSVYSQTDRKSSFLIQLDSRSTFVSNEAVNIFGIRGGLLLKEKWEIGIGLYGSRVLDFFGKEVTKSYTDNSLTPAVIRPATIGFKYISFYGEYTMVQSERWNLTANSQFGLGQVFIDIEQFDGSIRKKKEGKSLIEHSIKAKYKFNPWLQLIGGLGYRYLLSGEKQIKDAFNAPIYIISTEIDFKQLFYGRKKARRIARNNSK